MNTTIALPLSQLPTSLRREERAPDKTIVTAAEAAVEPDTLSGMHECVCVNPQCRMTFTAFLGGLCPVCYEAELEGEIRRKSGPLQFSKTFPKRAIEDTARMVGPSLAKARSLIPLLRGDDPRTRGCVVILLGDRGTGKTVMATYLAGMLGTGMYVKACDLFRKIRGTFASESKLSEADVLRPFETCDFLVIDEAQERKKDSDWELVTLTNLIDKRYDRFKSTAIIANLQQEALDAYVGASIVSRANRTGGGVVLCDWEPYC